VFSDRSFDFLSALVEVKSIYTHDVEKIPKRISLNNNLLMHGNLKKKSDAPTRRVSTFHILLKTSELAIFSRNPPQISKTSKSDDHALKHS
jgi:hypothetical protein